MAFGNSTFFGPGGVGTSTFLDLGGAVSDLFGGEAGKARAAGYEAEAAGYRRAAQLSLDNIPLEEAATKIQQTQSEREALKVIGGQISDVEGFGFKESGTGLDLLADSNRQAGLQNQLIGEQGSIQVNAYQQQADAYNAEADAAEAAAKAASSSSLGSFLGGALKIGAAVATLL